MVSTSSAPLHLKRVVGFLVGREPCVSVVAAALLLLTPGVGRAQQSESGTPQVLYSQGDPTNDEQYLLQKLNRARLDPVGEGQRLAAWLRDTPEGQEVVRQYGTDPDQVASDFAALPAAAPLAFNADLLAAARAHSADLAPHDGMGPGGNNHEGYDGSLPEDRAWASGFRDVSGVNLGYLTESFDSGASNLDESHASFLVDWGVPGLGHRVNAMNSTPGLNFLGIGLAIKPASLNSPMPIVNTEDFGASGVNTSGSTTGPRDVAAMLTGVVFNDANGNGQYDPGEGMAGVIVTMNGGKYYAVTSTSGGYALPLVNGEGSSADGTVPVRMTFADGGVFTSSVTINRYILAANPSAYRASIEWDGTAANDQPSPDPGQPYFGGAKAVFVSAGGVVKLRLFRPANSDLSQPYTVSYRLKGSAVAGVNYVALPPTLVVPAGERKVKVKVATLTGGNRATTLKIKLRGVRYRGTKTVTITS